eukprot:2816638-Rhodomonas_salina.1
MSYYGRCTQRMNSKVAGYKRYHDSPRGCNVGTSSLSTDEHLTAVSALQSVVSQTVQTPRAWERAFSPIPEPDTVKIDEPVAAKLPRSAAFVPVPTSYVAVCVLEPDCNPELMTTEWVPLVPVGSKH